MSLPDDQTQQTSATGVENIWPPPVARLRSITQQELDQLAAAIEKPVDRKHLEHWMTTAISNAVKLSSLPSARQARAKLATFASEGRRWIDHLDTDPIQTLLTQKTLQDSKGSIPALGEHRTKMQELKVAMTRICDQADAGAVELCRFVRRGGQRSTSPALIGFLDVMIGIAKWNGTPPSTPQRAMDSSKPPAFFVLVKKALSTARNVIGSSDLPDREKRVALKTLDYPSPDALIRIIERRRGLIRDYHPTHHGRLVEEKRRQADTRASRTIRK
jgi:hypothetical protein